MSIYQKVKKACDEKNISVMALEEKLGFPRSSICKWDKSVPGANKLKAVSNELGKPMEYFLEDDTTEAVQ